MTDVLIALMAIEKNLHLLHKDRDFDVISEQITELNIQNRIK